MFSACKYCLNTHETTAFIFEETYGPTSSRTSQRVQFGDEDTMRPGTFSGDVSFQLLGAVTHKTNVKSSHVELVGGLDEDPKLVSQLASKLQGILGEQFTMKLTVTPINQFPVNL